MHGCFFFERQSGLDIVLKFKKKKKYEEKAFKWNVLFNDKLCDRPQEDEMVMHLVCFSI